MRERVLSRRDERMRGDVHSVLQVQCEWSLYGVRGERRNAIRSESVPMSLRLLPQPHRRELRSLSLPVPDLRQLDQLQLSDLQTERGTDQHLPWRLSVLFRLFP